MADSFKIIYRILKTLEKAMQYDEFDEDLISAESLRITDAQWCAVMEMLADEGYVKGLTVKRSMDGHCATVNLCNIRITMSGLEYLRENSVMKKMANTAKGIIETIKP